jgi:hypothetical protein
MTTAILLTGGFRTLVQIFPSFYENVLTKNNCVLFIACEVDDPKRLYEILDAYPHLRIGHILHTPSFRDAQYHAIERMIETSDRPGLRPEVYERAKQKDGMDWPNFGPNFIKSSGSIIQYYQVWRLWPYVLEYEKRNHTKFTYCMRTRCDILFNKPIVLSDTFTQSNPWYNEYQAAKKIDNGPSYYHHTTYELVSSETRNDDYVITFCVDLVWMAKRDVFTKLSQLVFHYGLWDSGFPFSFNSETTFQEFCGHHNIHHYGITEANFPLYAHTMEDAKNYIMIILR